MGGAGNPRVSSASSSPFASQSRSIWSSGIDYMSNHFCRLIFTPPYACQNNGRPEMTDRRWRPDMTESPSTGSGGGSLPSFVPTAFLYIERSYARIMRQYNQFTIFTFIDPYIPTGYEPGLNALPIRYPSIIAPAVPATLRLAPASQPCTLVFFLSLNKHRVMTDSTTYTCKHGSTPILSARNYHSWKNNITNLLAMDDSLEIVLGTELAPVPTTTPSARPLLITG